MSSRHQVLRSAAAAAIPVIVGYLPIAFAFGMTGVTHGLSPEMTVAMSALIFAGASQFVLLAAIYSGTSWALVICLCALMDIRHLFYGALLKLRLNTTMKRNLLTAFTLTDEVFATALVKFQNIELEQRGLWLTWLGWLSYLSWVVGTALGAYLGLQLAASTPLLATAMKFSLPALFLILVYQTFKTGNRTVILVAALSACVAWLAGLSALALLLGAVAGCSAALFKGKVHATAS